jgi:hypothetical protein
MMSEPQQHFSKQSEQHGFGHRVPKQAPKDMDREEAQRRCGAEI